jgi:hypothetical protein
MYLYGVFLNQDILIEGNFIRNRNRMIDSGYGKAAKLYERSLGNSIIGNSAFRTRNKPLWGVWFEESIHSR